LVHLVRRPISSLALPCRLGVALGDSGMVGAREGRTPAPTSPIAFLALLCRLCAARDDSVMVARGKDGPLRRQHPIAFLAPLADIAPPGTIP